MNDYRNSPLFELFNTDDIELKLNNLLRLTLKNSNAYYVNKSVKKLLYKAGLSRSVNPFLSEIDMESEERDTLTNNYIKTINNYLSSVTDNKMKTLIVFLMEKGVLSEVIDEIKIPNPELRKIVTNYYEKTDPIVSSAMDEFFTKIPKLKVFDIPAWQYVNFDMSNILRKIGTICTPSEFKIAHEALKELRFKIYSYIYPDRKTLMELVSLNPSTYQRNITNVLVELKLELYSK